MKSIQRFACVSIAAMMAGCVVGPPPPPPPPPRPVPVVVRPAPLAPAPVVVVKPAPAPLPPPRTPLQRLGDEPLVLPTATPYDGRPQVRAHFLSGYQAGWTWIVSGHSTLTVPATPPSVVAPPMRQAWDMGALQGRNAAAARLAALTAPPPPTAPVPEAPANQPLPGGSVTPVPSSTP